MENNLVIWSAVENQTWWDRLGKVYESLNVIGYEIDRMRQAGKLPSRELMELQSTAIHEFYSLLTEAGADIDGPEVSEVV